MLDQIRGSSLLILSLCWTTKDYFQSFRSSIFITVQEPRLSTLQHLAKAMVESFWTTLVVVEQNFSSSTVPTMGLVSTTVSMQKMLVCDASPIPIVRL